MDNQAHLSFVILDRSYLSLYKKEIHKLAVDNGFGETRIAEIDIIVAEITSNLLKHARGGELLVKIVDDEGAIGMELISVDNGPGMAEPQKMVLDGVSTTNTLGHGLGAIKRLSDTFQLYSLKDWGTVLLSRVYKTSPYSGTIKEAKMLVRTVMVPKPGETFCGDGYYQKQTKDHWKIMAADGLGHGKDAHYASGEAITAFRNDPSNDPVEMIRGMHTAVKRTRGLVGTIAVYNIQDRVWHIAGVGNISTCMISGLVSKTYMPYNGVIGMNIPNTIKSQQIENMHNQILIMCSDGIKTRWDIQKYPLIMKYDASVLAAAIYKDFSRKTDDMMVMVCKVNQ